MGNIGSSPSFQTEEDRANMYDARTNEIWLPDRMRDGARRPLKEGDMIQFQRGKYEHWAVYVGKRLAVSDNFSKFFHFYFIFH